MSKAIEQLQYIISFNQPGILIDGVWGIDSSRRFERLSAIVKKQIISKLTSMDDPLLIDFELMRNILFETFKIYEVPQSAAANLLRIEPSVITLDGNDYVDLTHTYSPRYRGPFQMSKVAWKEALNSDANIISMDFAFTSLSDPVVASHLSAMYMKHLATMAKTTGHRPSGDLLYAMYNQGPSFLMKGHRLLGNQSDDALQIIASAKKHLARA